MADHKSTDRDSGNGRRSDSRTSQRALIGAGLAVAAAGAAVLYSRTGRRDDDDGDVLSDAPAWTLRDPPEGEEGPLVGNSVMINLPRHDIYRRWRDFTAFPQFMDNVERVEKIDDQHSRWTIKALAGTSVELVTEITADEPGTRIAWRTTADSQVAASGEARFEDAPPGRGTYVRLIQSYDPPAGIVGKAIAKLFQREPNVQARRDLRRFKQLLETGEVAVNASPSGRPSENPAEPHI